MFPDMTEPRLYLDHAATTPLLPQAREALLDGYAAWANPSSPHAPGREARAKLEDARDRVRSALGWEGEIVFTSGASEALAIAMTRCGLPVAAVSPVEHDAVLRFAGDAQRLPVDSCGCVDADAAASDGLVAVQHVNNETGVIQPLAAVAEAVHRTGGLLLADCAQSAGKLALPDADMIAIAAHKFGGPVGIGALLLREWSLVTPSGGQERGYRAGTENMPLACAMAAALEAGPHWQEEAAGLRRVLDETVKAAGGEIVAETADRVPGIGAIRMPGVSAAAQLIRFDAQGIAVSAGSACSSGSMRTSHVHEAMGLNPAFAAETIRVSIGRETTRADLSRFLDAWLAMAEGAKARA